MNHHLNIHFKPSLKSVRIWILVFYSYHLSSVFLSFFLYM
jgi:hypothetical protein